MSRLVWPPAASVATRSSLGERLDAREGGRARPGARRVELRAHVLLERLRPADLAYLERAAQRLARVRGAPRPAQLGAQGRERPRALQPLGAPLEQSHGLLELVHPLRAEERAEHPERATVRGGSAPAACQLDLLPASLIASSRRPSRASACAFNDLQGAHAGLRECCACRS